MKSVVVQVVSTTRIIWPKETSFFRRT